MPRVPTHVVKERTREVSALFASYSTNASLVGTEHEVLVTEIASDGIHLVGHTKGYVQVLLPHTVEHMGCMLRVRIFEAAKFYTRGEVLQVNRRASSSAPRAGDDACRLRPRALERCLYRPTRLCPHPRVCCACAARVLRVCCACAARACWRTVSVPPALQVRRHDCSNCRHCLLAPTLLYHP